MYVGAAQQSYTTPFPHPTTVLNPCQPQPRQLESPIAFELSSPPSNTQSPGILQGGIKCFKDSNHYLVWIMIFGAILELQPGRQPPQTRHPSGKKSSDSSYEMIRVQWLADPSIRWNVHRIWKQVCIFTAIDTGNHDDGDL